MLNIYQFEGEEKGEHVLILGAIHGDEVCGPMAITKVIERFVNKTLVLQRGKVTFVPVCNPSAYTQNIRYVDRNLNRFMTPIDEPKVYEDSLTNVICPLLESADVLLDIHSYHVGGAPFIFIEQPNGKEVPYAQCLGVSHMVYGFQNAYVNADGAVSEDALKEGMGTTEYLRQFGGYGVTLECGQHNDLESIVVAERAIENTFQYFNMLDGDALKNHTSQIIEIQKVYYNEENAEFCEEWCNFQSVPKGTKIARYSGGEVVSVQEDSYIVLPRKDAPVDEEWFYIGRSVA